MGLAQDTPPHYTHQPTGAGAKASPAFRALADEKLAKLAAKQEEWGAMLPQDKAQVLAKMQAALKGAQVDLPAVSDACVLKQGFADASDPNADSAWCIEQICNAAFVAAFTRKMKTTLEAVAKDGKCPPAKAVRELPDGRRVVDVFPLPEDSMDPKKAWTVELQLKTGQPATQGACLERRPRAGSCGLVLGAGNVGALAVMDCLHLLFQCNTVVLLKVHPLRTYQEGFIRTIFAPLIEMHAFDTIVEESGLPDAAYLVNHKLLCQIHMTGATETHDAIVWGPRGEREDRKQWAKPAVDLNKVTVTSELGCVTPWVVPPTMWTEEELELYAKHLAVMVTANNSYYCNSPKVLVLSEEWGQREVFVEKLRAIFNRMPNPPPYYPGSYQRYQGFVDAYSAAQVEKIESPAFAQAAAMYPRIPWTLVHITADAANLAASAGEYAFTHEAFCPVLTICTLKGTRDPAEFLVASTKLCNEHIWGTLSCVLVVHPEVQRTFPDAVEKAINGLEYGSVVVNAWSGEAYGMPHGVWGGYADGNREQLDNVQSGIGFVNNCLLFDHPAKGVFRAPFNDKTKIGAGKPLTRPATGNLVNLLINPGLAALAKFLCPTLCCCCGVSFSRLPAKSRKAKKTE